MSNLFPMGPASRACLEARAKMDDYLEASEALEGYVHISVGALPAVELPGGDAALINISGDTSTDRFGQPGHHLAIAPESREQERLNVAGAAA